MSEVVTIQRPPRCPATIVLTAIRAGQGFAYRIERPGRDAASTTSAAETAELLRRLGIINPVDVVLTAEEWRNVVVHRWR